MARQKNEIKKVQSDYLDANYSKITISDLSRETGLSYTDVRNYLAEKGLTPLLSYQVKPKPVFKKHVQFVQPDYEEKSSFVRPSAIYSNPDYSKF